MNTMLKIANLLRVAMVIGGVLSNPVYGMGWFSQGAGSLYDQVTQGASTLAVCASKMASDALGSVDVAETASAVAESLSSAGSSLYTGSAPYGQLLVDSACAATGTAKAYLSEVDPEFIKQQALQSLEFASFQGHTALAQASWTSQGQEVLARLRGYSSAIETNSIEGDEWEDVVVKKEVKSLGGRPPAVITKTKGYIKPKAPKAPKAAKVAKAPVAVSAQRMSRHEMCERLSEGTFIREKAYAQNQVLPSFFAAKTLTGLAEHRNSRRTQRV